MTSAVSGRRSFVVRRDPTAMVVLVGDDGELASWPLACWGRSDLALVYELARLQLAARRVGWSIQLRDACPDLLELVDLVGLSEVVIEIPRPAAGGD